MEPLMLITTALSLVKPFLVKAGESFAEGVGEDIWELIKRPFNKVSDEPFKFDINNHKDKERLINILLDEVNKDNDFKNKLEDAVLKCESLRSSVLNVNNNDKIEKQVNIHQNNGNIQF